MTTMELHFIDIWESTFLCRRNLGIHHTPKYFAMVTIECQEMLNAVDGLGELEVFIARTVAMKHVPYYNFLHCPFNAV